jgi:5-methylcytosine-specific restriction endonuclease McrA
MTRAVDEWIGKTDNTMPPPRVKLRIFEAHGGKCYITGRKLMPGEFDFDHIQALCNGGENRESNLAPVYRPAHRAKTARDVAQKAKDNRVRAKHLGITKAARPMPGSKASKWKKRLDGTVVLRDGFREE